MCTFLVFCSECVTVWCLVGGGGLSSWVCEEVAALSSWMCGLSSCVCVSAWCVLSGLCSHPAMLGSLLVIQWDCGPYIQDEGLLLCFCNG